MFMFSLHESGTVTEDWRAMQSIFIDRQ